MKITKQFSLAYPRDVVWKAMGDVYQVAECLPGASIVEDMGDNRYKGKFSVKVGPMAASFAGEVGIERKPEDWTAVVTGKGADARSGSRATGSMTYALAARAADQTDVDVLCEINLAGALAQFGKGAVIQEIANRITAEFVRNFEAKVAASAPADASQPQAGQQGSAPQEPRAAESLDVGNLFWTMMKERIAAFFRRLSGGSK
jgi:carbon monoxide dehydrogenase subunit G